MGSLEYKLHILTFSHLFGNVYIIPVKKSLEGKKLSNILFPLSSLTLTTLYTYYIYYVTLYIIIFPYILQQKMI